MQQGSHIALVSTALIKERAFVYAQKGYQDILPRISSYFCNRLIRNIIICLLAKNNTRGHLMSDLVIGVGTWPSCGRDKHLAKYI